MTVLPVAPARRQELAERLEAVRARLAAAERAAGREPGSTGLVVVTKFHPVADVATLLDLGVTDIGESRDDEAADKVAALQEAGVGLPTVHFVGQVQTRKARSVAGYADLVHSLDRAKLCGALERGAAAAGRVLDVLVQVDLADGADAGRGGARPGEVADLARAVADAEYLRLRGVMAVAPLGADPEGAFATLSGVAADVRADHPAADVVSAGMSGDLEAAVRAGSTLVRVGSAILGPRPTRG